MADKPSILCLVSEIRDLYQQVLEQELEKFGMKGLVSSHAAILACLYKSQGTLKMSEISDKIGKTKSTVTELVARLARKGYVKKISRPEDKRVVEVQVTEKGLELKQAFYAISGKLLKTLYQGILSEAQESAVSVLMQVKGNLEGGKIGN